MASPEHIHATWIPAFERSHYMCGFHNSSYSGGGQNARGSNFALYAAALHYLTFGIFPQYTVRGAWKKANLYAPYLANRN